MIGSPRDLPKQNLQELLEHIFTCRSANAFAGFCLNDVIFCVYSTLFLVQLLEQKFFTGGMFSFHLFLSLISVAVIDEACFSSGADVGRGQSYKTPLKTDATPSRGSSGGLSRSHSSPNIAKMIQDEEDGVPASTQLPRQLPPDRSTKPQMMYAGLCIKSYFYQSGYLSGIVFISCETKGSVTTCCNSYLLYVIAHMRHIARMS